MPLPSCSFLHLFCFLLEVAHLCNLFIIQISCRNPWIVFAEEGHCTKVVRRKWKIEKNNKEQVQNLEHYRMLPGSGTKERRNKKEEFFTKN